MESMFHSVAGSAGSGSFETNHRAIQSHTKTLGKPWARGSQCPYEELQCPRPKRTPAPDEGPPLQDHDPIVRTTTTLQDHLGNDIARRR